jgi:outer membrane protein
MTDKKFVMFLTLLMCAKVMAGDTNSVPKADANMTLLVGPSIVILDKPYAGKHAEVFPYPAAVIVYDRFYWVIDTAGYRLLANQRTATPAPGTTLLYLDAVAKWRSDGYDSSDSDELEGMHDRRRSVDVGGEFGVSGDWGSVATSLVTDALGRHNGQEVRSVYTRPFKNAFDVNNLNISPSAGLAWQNNELVDYYYGVRRDEARPGRPEYHPGQAVNWLWGIDTNYRLNESWTLFGGFTYYYLDSDIRHSPIVDRNYAISIIAGAMYKF